MYKEITTTEMPMIQRQNADGSVTFIPKDLANSDYQAYLEQLTESVTDDPKGNK
jgi:hypothetical protein